MPTAREDRVLSDPFLPRLGKRSSDHHALAFAASIDGMAILDAAGTYLFVNPAHARLYGFDHPDQLVGRSWKVLYRGDEL